MKMKSIAVAGILASASIVTATASVIDFDDLTVPLSGYENGEHLTGAFTSRGAGFNNFYDETFGPYFEGFAYSMKGDTTTAGYLNQYSVFTGGGSDANGVAVPGNVFGVGFVGFTVPAISLAPDQSRPLSLRVTNTTYAALSMTNGDGFSKKFGGLSGNDPDFFKMTVSALDASDALIGTLEVYLADFRFANNSLDYILRDWTEVDLTSFGDGVNELRFTLASSDNGQFGINTPAYFAIDNVAAVPEPGSVALLLTGLAAIGSSRRRS